MPDRERTVTARRIAATDRRIDEFVGEFHGLIEKEIAVVEEAAASG